jgi:hypothetical protein
MIFKNPVRPIFAIAALSLFACNNANESARSDSNAKPADTLPKVSADNETATNTIAYNEIEFPVDSTLPVKVLPVGLFHNDEVPANAGKMQWFGLFKNNAGYHLARTRIKTVRAHDPVLDEDEKTKTGWEVSATHKDSCLLLIEALPYLADRPIPKTIISENHIYPGDTLSLSYSGVEYKIFATGNKKKAEAEPDWFVVSDYKLYITATINGQLRKSLLVAQPDFDDRMTCVVFGGDIDGDGILDLLIDTSDHYNMGRPTIYLSKPAGKTEVVKPVGVHTSVGC